MNDFAGRFLERLLALNRGDFGDGDGSGGGATGWLLALLRSALPRPCLPG